MRIKINREQPFQVLATNFSIGPSSSGYDLQISADGVNFTTLFSVGANVTRMVTGVANGSTYRLQYNTDEDVIVNWERQCNDGGSGGSGSQGPEGPQGPQGYQGAEGAQGPQGADGIDQDPTLLKSVSELPATADTGDVVSLSVEGTSQVGVYQYDGTDWNAIGGGAGGGDYIILDTLSGVTGVSGQLYSYHNRLYRWIDGAGRWGKWIIGYDNNSNMFDYNVANNTAYSHLVYSYFPFTASTWLCQFKLLSDNRYLAYNPSDNVLEVYDQQNFAATPLATVSMNGEEVAIASSNRSMYISWAEGCITFRQVSSWVQMQSNSYADTSVSSSHFEALEVDTFKGKTAFNNNTGIGLVLSNSEGINQFTIGMGTYRVYANTTGYGSNMEVYTRNNSGFPQRIWVPTTGGTAGQILTSNGNNSAPTWTNWIKAVKITSDAYEALQVKDPNTLYLIDDE